MSPPATPAVQADLRRVGQMTAYHATRVGHPPNAIVEQMIRGMAPSALLAFFREFQDVSDLCGPEYPEAVQARRDHYAQVASDELYRRQKRFVTAVLGCFADTEARR